MTVERMVFGLAGALALISLALSRFHSPYRLWFPTFAGANMLQAAFTGFCPLAKILHGLGLKPGEAFKYPEK